MPPPPSGLHGIAFCAVGLLLVGVAAGVAQSPAEAPPTDVKQLYDRSCASCHGTDGRGLGPAADALNPKPRDFTRGHVQVPDDGVGLDPGRRRPVPRRRRRAAGHVHAGLEGRPERVPDARAGGVREAVLAALRDPIGRAAGRAEAAGARRPPASRRAAPRTRRWPAAPATATPAAAPTRWRAGCRTTGATQSFAPNLAEPWAFRGGRTASDIYMRLKTGINGTPDAVVRRHREGRRSPGRGQLRRVARAQAGLGDERRRTEGPLREAGGSRCGLAR